MRTSFDLVEVLTDNQRELREMLVRVAELPPVAEGETGPQARRRRRWLRLLGRRFVQTEAVAQRHLWPVLRREWPDGPAVVADRKAGKREVEELLVRLGWSAERDPYIDDLTAELVDAVRRHVDGTDRLMPRYAAFDPRERESLGYRLQEGLSRAPTRPHPDLPASPLLAVLLDPVIGTIDRIRDGLEHDPSGL